MAIFSDLLSLVFQEGYKQEIGIITLDITTDISCGHSAEIADEPVESSFRTFNYNNRPNEVTINGFMSEYARAGLSSTLSGVSKTNRLSLAKNELIKFKETGQPIDLVTKYATYPNMVIKSLNIDYGANSGAGYKIYAVFKEVKFINTEIVYIDNLKIEEETAKSNENKGFQAENFESFTIKEEDKINLQDVFFDLFE
jgi:hypothetical protein